MNSYRCSNGERFTQSQIERKITQAKGLALEKQLDDFDYNFCYDCGKNAIATYLDCSHEISVKEAKESGRTELCWDVENIKIRCRSCHKIHDKLV